MEGQIMPREETVVRWRQGKGGASQAEEDE